MNFFNVALHNFRFRKSLRYRALRAGSWAIGGHVTTQALRMGGNLILTRLLFPEAFGLMTIVQSVVTGLALLSDVGIETCIIQNKRGHEAIFVNTAWTMKVIRGVIIWLVLCTLTPLIASFYAQPMLVSLLPVVGFGSVLGGFASTKLATNNRSLVLKKLVLIEVGSYACGLLVMILWAWIDRSIWSLVGGGLFGALVKTVASHLLLEGVTNKFAWERDSFKELFGFGQWVLVSSGLTFLAGAGNQLLIGKLLDIKLLAFFTLANTLSYMYMQLAQQLNSKVMFPVYSELVRERPEHLRVVAAKSRLFIIVPGWLIALFFVLWGDHLMWILYDQRYAESGHMLRMLAMGSMVSIIGGSYNGLLWARGMVRLSSVLLIAQIVIQVSGMIIGHHYLGERGVILGAALVGWLLYPVEAYVHARISLWQPKIDFLFIALSLLIVALNFKEIFSHV